MKFTMVVGINRDTGKGDVLWPYGNDWAEQKAFVKNLMRVRHGLHESGQVYKSAIQLDSARPYCEKKANVVLQAEALAQAKGAKPATTPEITTTLPVVTPEAVTEAPKPKRGRKAKAE